MKLDYKIEIDYTELELTLIILKQDERFWKKEYDGNSESFKYNCKNGMVITSKSYVAIFEDNKIFLKGFGTDYNQDCLSFKTLEKLNSYHQRLVEALEEFKQWDGEQEKTFTKKRNY